MPVTTHRGGVPLLSYPGCVSRNAVHPMQSLFVSFDLSLIELEFGLDFDIIEAVALMDVELDGWLDMKLKAGNANLKPPLRLSWSKRESCQEGKGR